MEYVGPSSPDVAASSDWPVPFPAVVIRPDRFGLFPEGCPEEKEEGDQVSGTR